MLTGQRERGRRGLRRACVVGCAAVRRRWRFPLLARERRRGGCARKMVSGARAAGGSEGGRAGPCRGSPTASVPSGCPAEAGGAAGGWAAGSSEGRAGALESGDGRPRRAPSGAARGGAAGRSASSPAPAAGRAVLPCCPAGRGSLSAGGGGAGHKEPAAESPGSAAQVGAVQRQKQPPARCWADAPAGRAAPRSPA